MITKKQTKAINRKAMANKTRSEQLKKKNYRRHT
jgi:hypothetical protein